ncbi:hypothetical protein CAPTEDRAFT_211821 [Capitella teleta]|uniref:Endonuclease/exonuclease/phosphatase domain-containing protein n=1 Tax=Capitella teleta TaxID=283909 RepID=R7URB6_CAPTE|nr:hypothetical protein CAPTEDRAFT_211821 [Capitella teleta]|eukprot:ELU06472.1 hypothetical protein CAPTEDRAFT_211821 [Capitella teleta]
MKTTVLDRQRPGILNMVLLNPWLLVIYRPPNNCPMSQFHTEFSNILEMLAQHSGNVMIVGDLNAYLDDPADRDANDFGRLITAFGLQQHVQQATHRNGQTLDLAITRIDDHTVKALEANDYGFPDHYSVLIETVTYRRYKRITDDQLHATIMQSELSAPSPAQPLTEIISMYETHLLQILDEMALLRTREMERKGKWYSDGVRAAKQERCKTLKEVVEDRFSCSSRDLHRTPRTSE